MRPADDAVFHAVGSSERRKIHRSLKLMRLHADQSQQGRLIRITKEIEIAEIRLYVLIDGVRLNLNTIDGGWRHASQIGNSAVRHEASAEALDVAAQAVLAWLDDDDAKHRSIPLIIARARDCV